MKTVKEILTLFKNGKQILTKEETVILKNGARTGQVHFGLNQNSEGKLIAEASLTKRGKWMVNR